MSTFIEQLKERAKKDIKTIVLAEGEEIRTLKAAEMVKKEFPSLCVAMIKNPSPRQIVRPCFLSDEDFERDKTPMTKEEIRILILHKMK